MNPQNADPFTGGQVGVSPGQSAAPMTPEAPYAAPPSFIPTPPLTPQAQYAPQTVMPAYDPMAQQPVAGQYAAAGTMTTGHVPHAKPAPKSNPNSTQNTLQISEIRDGIVIMSDGSFRSVIMTKAINFDLMSQQEREAVEYSYQGFLNSLDFPIQIFIRSQKVDMRPYLEKLDKIRSEHDNMLLALLMEDYIDFMSTLTQQTNIMDKKFYVVIPWFPGVDAQKAVLASKNFLTNVFGSKEQHVTIDETVLENAKTELRNKVQAVLSGLLQCGIQGLPLDTQELIELYYDAYNPDTATRQQIKNFSDLTAPVVTKGQGAAPQPNLEKELR